MNYKNMWMELKYQLMKRKNTDTLILTNEIELEAYEEEKFHERQKKKVIDTAFMDLMKEAAKKEQANG